MTDTKKLTDLAAAVKPSVGQNLKAWVTEQTRLTVDHEGRLRTLEGVTPPPPPPPPPPTPGPVIWEETLAGNRWASWWQVAGPADGAAVVDDGEGGKALELRTPPNAPGGGGVLSALWTGDGPHSHGFKGAKDIVEFEFRFAANYNGWIHERHENYNRVTNNSIYSNALGVLPDRRFRVQQTGGPVNPHLGGKPNGQVVDSPSPLVPNVWHTLRTDFIGSERHDTGLWLVTLNGVVVNQQIANRGTLLTDGSSVDELAFGFYGYPYTAMQGSTWVQFRKIRMVNAA